MFTISNNVISIIAGDTGIINLKLDNHNLGIGDTVYFTVTSRTISAVTKTFEYSNVIKQKITEFEEDGSAKIYLNREDTIDLNPGSYMYDIQVNTIDGRIDTVVPPNRFKVLEGISNEY